MKLARKPQQNSNLLLQPIDTELMAYDARSDKAHLLKSELAELLKLCDGNRDWETLAEELQLTVDELVPMLGALNKKGLLLAESAENSRREFLVKGGMAAAALPVILTSTLAKPAAAGSGACDGALVCGPCTVGNCGDDCGPCDGSSCCLDGFDLANNPIASNCGTPTGIQTTGACAGLIAGNLDCETAKLSCCNSASCRFYACCGTTTSCLCPPASVNGFLPAGQRCGDAGTDGLPCCGGGTCSEFGMPACV